MSVHDYSILGLSQDLLVVRPVCWDMSPDIRDKNRDNIINLSQIHKICLISVQLPALLAIIFECVPSLQ